MRKGIIAAAAGIGALLSLVSANAQGVSITTDQASYTLDPVSNAVDVTITATGLPAACEGLRINLRITATADGSGTAAASRPAEVSGGTATAVVPYPGIAGEGTRYSGASDRDGPQPNDQPCLGTSPIVGASFVVTSGGGTPTSTPTSPPTETPTTPPTETSTETSTGTATETGTATGTGTSTGTTTGSATPRPPSTGVGDSNSSSLPFALIALGAVAALAVGSAGFVLKARR